MKISELRKKSNQFTANLRTIISKMVEDNDDKLIELNQKQLKGNKNAKGESIRPLYSESYARKKGYYEPDGYLTGQMYREMFAVVDENKLTYDLSSFAEHTKYFANRYGDVVFGISPSNQPTAQRYYTAMLTAKYKQMVLS